MERKEARKYRYSIEKRKERNTVVDNGKSVLGGGEYVADSLHMCTEGMKGLHSHATQHTIEHLFQQKEM